VQVVRMLLRRSEGYLRFVNGSVPGYSAGFLLDAVVLPSPYAYAFGFFLNFSGSAWFSAGSTFSSLYNTLRENRTRKNDEPGSLPTDMSPTSLVGGGLIAGDALAALGLGMAGLAHTLLG